MYDVFFQCFDELNADENFEVLKQKAPQAQRVDNVVGIHNAHKFCAEQCKTDLFYLVDGDSRIRDDFEFKYEGFDNKVYLWKATDGVYGHSTYHGGLKLFPKDMVLNAGDWGIKYFDSTITISDKKHILINEIASSHLYNTSPLHTWRTIFREYMKQVSKEKPSTISQIQLKLYLTYGNRDMPGYAWYAKMGANAAHSYYEKHKNSPEKLMIINDYDKLSDMFNEFNYLDS
jgi:hypothetical protein